MKNIYAENSANFPRLQTDRLFYDENAKARYEGILDESFAFIEKKQLLDRTLWARFVCQFRDHTDTDGGWRGEYWGKMMRGACFVYAYTKNEELYRVLTETIEDMLSAAAEEGRISSYPQALEFDGWDLWSRKYVLLGMQYFLEVCPESPLKEKLIASMSAQVDYLIARIGLKEAGKLPITEATRHWRGLNACSILEPIVRLYSLTGEKRYLDFAAYIVNTGATDVVNIFDLAYENDFSPYQYPVTKAYEMTSCFEGLLEYYRITKNDRHKTALINYADRILTEEFTVIGCAGCTHELFDKSAVRQANTTNYPKMQETCVTVTLMKFFYQLHLLTGEARYADAFERSLYNAYLGAINTEGSIEYDYLKESHPDCKILEPLPFASYSPLTAGTRASGIGGLKLMPDGHYYGCCACIGSAGLGLVPRMHTLLSEKGIVMNLFIGGTLQTSTPSGAILTINTETEYPKNGDVRITFTLAKAETFTLSLRNPAWNTEGKLFLNGEELPMSKGYTEITRTWQTGDLITLSLDMRTEIIRPIPYGELILMNKVIWGKNYMIQTFDREDPRAACHRAFRRGPLMLAADERLADPEKAIAIKEEGAYIDAVLQKESSLAFPHLVEVALPLKDGSSLSLIDYASAGKNYQKKIAVWLPTE